MNIRSNHSNTSRYSGKVLASVIMLIFVFIALAIFMAYGIRASAVSKYDKAEAEMAALNSAKAQKPLVGVVKGVILNPPSSSAVVDEAIVHAGDVIHEITVVGIHDNKVEFAKDGNSWQQGVLESPNAAWPQPVKVTKLPGK